MTSAFTSSPQIFPSIPSEVWFKIFALAVDLDDFFNYGDSISADLPCTLVKKHKLQLLKKSLFTKCRIVLVSKAWNKLALELLYQNIIIVDTKRLLSIHDLLQRHTLTSQSENGLGWWTKRLDVVLEDQHCEASDCGRLASVIRQLPNLSTVTLSLPMLRIDDCWLRQLPSTVITSLVETCGVSLEVFDCFDSTIRPRREDLMVLLAASPNLKTLRCPIFSPTPSSQATRIDLDVPTMPKLESITLISVFLQDYLPKDNTANPFPALRCLTYDYISPPFLDHPWKNFMRTTCKNLTSVTLDFYLSGDFLQAELDLLSKCCTALEKLVIYFRSWLELKPCLELPPVSYLGLHSKALKEPPLHYRAMISGLVTLIAPKLRTVRLLHADAAKELRENASLCAAVVFAFSTFCNFSLEDSDGHVLSY